MYDHTFYKQVQISRSDTRPHIKWAVSLVILHMITSIFLRACVGIYGLTYSLYHPEGIILGAEITEVNLSAFVYRLFPEDLTSLIFILTLCVYYL